MIDLSKATERTKGKGRRLVDDLSSFSRVMFGIRRLIRVMQGVSGGRDNKTKSKKGLKLGGMREGLQEILRGRMEISLRDGVGLVDSNAMVCL